MKRLVLAGLLAFASISPAVSKPIKLDPSPEVRAKISAYVTEKAKPVSFKTRLGEGKKVESDVALSDIPADWGANLAKYKYVYSDDKRVLFVDPASREIVHAIKVK